MQVIEKKKLTYVNSQKVEDLGFFIGLHTKKISDEIAEYISESLLNIDKM